MNFYKVLADEVLTEEHSHSRAKANGGLVAGSTEIHPTVVQTSISVHSDELALLFGQGVIGGNLSVRAHGRLELEGELDLHAGDDEDLRDGDFDVLEGGRVDGGIHVLDSSYNIDNALLGDLSGVVDHRLRDISALEQAALDGIDVLAENDEAALSLVVDVEGASTKEDLLTNMLLEVMETRGLSNLLQRKHLLGPLLVGSLSRLNERKITVLLVGRNNGSLRAVLLLSSLHLTELLLGRTGLLLLSRRKHFLPSSP